MFFQICNFSYNAFWYEKVMCNFLHWVRKDFLKEVKAYTHIKNKTNNILTWITIHTFSPLWSQFHLKTGYWLDNKMNLWLFQLRYTFIFWMHCKGNFQLLFLNIEQQKNDLQSSTSGWLKREFQYLITRQCSWYQGSNFWVFLKDRLKCYSGLIEGDFLDEEARTADHGSSVDIQYLVGFS